MNIKKHSFTLIIYVLDIFSKVQFKNTRVYPRLWQLVGAYIQNLLPQSSYAKIQQRAEISP